MEPHEDLATALAIQTEAYVDVAAALADPEVIHTYQCGAATSCIDRVVVSRSMWARVRALHIVPDMATGPHRPLVIQFHTDAVAAPPRLSHVGEILEGTDPPSAVDVQAWQTTKLPDFALFEQAAIDMDVNKMYQLWASVWESYLLLNVPHDFDRVHCLGRAAAAVHFTSGEKVREGRAVLTDAERQLWRLKGLAQVLMQRRAVFEQRTWRRLRLLWASISARRSLDVPLEDDLSKLPALVDQISAAIKQERAIARAARQAHWRTELAKTGGVNALTRKLVKGSSTPVHIVRHEGQDIVCPQKQADLLCAQWTAIGAGEEPTDVPADLINRCEWTPLYLPLHNAESVRAQIMTLKSRTAHSLDWWRPAELKRLPSPAFAMLANIFNVSEQVGHLPDALQRGMIAAVSKGSSVVQPLGVRPICLLPMLHRVWSSSRFQHMANWADHTTAEAQAAYKRNRSARGEVIELLDHLNLLCARGSGGYLGQLDLSKAFPRLCHRKTTTILAAAGAPRWLVSILLDACLRKSLAWRVNGRLSAFIAQERGTPQGCALSILLFQLSLAPVIKELEAKIQADGSSARLLIYADDIIIFAETLEYLQELLTVCSFHMTRMGMLVNEGKSSVTPINKSMPFAPKLNGVDLPIKVHTDLLGCSVVQSSSRLPPPNAMVRDSALRSIQRRCKILDRLSRLRTLAVHTEAKEALWRQVILPIMTFDPWVALPTNQSAKSWRAHIANS
eukprot:6467060-Amphidinium_carterae.1